MGCARLSPTSKLEKGGVHLNTNYQRPCFDSKVMES